MKDLAVGNRSYAEYQELLTKYNARLEQLHSLITDPAGSFYLQDMSQDEYLDYYQNQVIHTAAFLHFAGDPQEQFPSIHIAGTSGKGSVTSMLGAILTQCGMHTGIHTSPYLQVCNEKLALNNRIIAPSDFISLIDRFEMLHKAFLQQKGSVPLRYQEAWGSLVHLWFAQNRVEWAVIETGIGGRYDPTNVSPSKLAVITNIGLDHIPQLGTNLKEIANHKAGIIKQGRPVIVSEQNPDIVNIIQKEADLKEAKLYRLGKDFTYTIRRSDSTGVYLYIQTPFNRYNQIHLTQIGTFHAANAATAVMAADVIANEYGVPVTITDIKSALKNWSFPGRMETIVNKPRVILDSAHNPPKMQALATSMKSAFPNKAITLIIGMLKFKDIDQSMSILLPQMKRIIITEEKVFGKPSMPINTLADRIRRILPGIEIIECENIYKSINIALSIVNPEDLILITGSIYLIGKARSYWVPSDQLLIEAENRLYIR